MAAVDAQHPFEFGDGDIQATATWQNERLVFKVSSAALAYASPVWKKFIFPPFKQLSSGKEKDVEQLDFTEDDPEALLVLLRIAHLQFAKIPHFLQFNVLLQVAVLCDQYDCVSLVLPWIREWLKDEMEGYESNGKWLFVAWVFGRQNVFENAARYWTEYSDLNDVTGLTTVKEPMPPGIMESLTSARLDLVKLLLQITNQQVQLYMDGGPPHGTVCQNHYYTAPSRLQCDSVALGSLIIGLRRNHIWPLPSAEDCRMSVSDLGSAISSLEIQYEKGHSLCNSKSFMESINKVLKAIPCPILDSHLRHMEVQAAKLKTAFESEEAIPDEDDDDDSDSDSD